MQNPFTQHPHSIGETYLEHACIASRSGARMVLSGLACIIHSVFPFLFIDTASNTIRDLHTMFSERKQPQTKTNQETVN